MNSLLLEGLVDRYVRNLVPLLRKEQALLEMAELLRDPVTQEIKREYILASSVESADSKIPDDYDWSSDEGFMKDVERRTKTQSMKYYEMIATIMEMLDKGDCGFLTGDLTPKLIVWMQKLVSQLIASLEFVSLDLSLTTKKRDMIINNFYQELFKTVSENLFKLPANGIPYPDAENPRNLFERQLILEDESSEISVEKFTSMYQTMQDLNMTHKLKVSTNPMIHWLPPLCRLIKEEQIKCTEPDLTGDRVTYGPSLLKLSPEKLSIISLTELMKLIMKISTMREDDSYNTHGYFIINKILFQNIGKAVAMQMQLESEEHSINLKIKEELKARQAEGKTGAQVFLNRKAQMLKAQAAENIFRGKMKERIDSMNKTVQIQLGSLLSYMMICALKTRNSQGESINLLSTGYIRADSNPNSKKKIGITRIEEYFIHNLVEFIEKKDSLLVHLDRSLPMIYKPANWIDPKIGGYFQRPTSFVRQTESPAFERAVRFSDMSKMFSVLDLLGSVPWRINKKVLNVVEELWNLGGAVGEIPSRYYDYKDYTYEYQVKECTDTAERRKLLKQIQLQRDVHGLRCDFNLKLDQARAFAKVAKIYYPHNVDFRGRVYPIPPHLNHMSSDICRGLLEFGDGKPLGKSGLRWLKIHLANKMGRDKLSMEARHDYGESVLPLVEKVVQDPIKNREWLDNEDCWQTLAAMFELHAAVTSPNPEEYISHLHIHQDGSCNGLQHYAALGRDLDGGFQVNLVNREIPGDLYTHIANMVEKKILEDVKEGVIDKLEIAKKLSGNVKRKIIKQTVMTTVYGVTFIGARKQIEKQLRDKDFLDHSDDKESYAASIYLAKTTLDCVANLFSQAHAIKQWLKDCSKLISLYGQPMSWVTPLG